MILTTSTNLIGLACVGTATNSSKLSIVEKVRINRVLMWLGTPSSSHSKRQFRCSSALGTQKPKTIFADTATQLAVGTSLRHPCGLVLPVRETELMRRVFQFQKRI